MAARSCYIIIVFLILASNCHNSNTTSVFDTKDEHHTSTKYVAFILYTVLLLCGIISNLLMMIVLFVRGNVYSHAFILISLQLIISNFVIFLVQTADILPEILRNKSTSEGHQTMWVTHVFPFLRIFAIFSTLHFIFLLTLNRYVTLIFPKHNAFFESVRLYFLLGLVWLSVFVITTVEFHYCTTRYHVSSLRWKRNCTKQPIESTNIFLSFLYVWTIVLPVAIFVMYIMIFYNIQRKRRSILDINQIQKTPKMYGGHVPYTVSTGNYERIMLIQAAIICGATEISILIYNFLPWAVLKIFGQKANIPLGIFVNCCTILYRMLLPTIYFIYDKQARNIVKHQFLRLRLRFSIEKITVRVQMK
uniref:G_PROTEIN_RECEP_F1_2 domain-containing protein n=1 Tax=Onchocerca volvulus TaxID=6282 RepID=A0A8R1Y4M4_ONCVO